MSQLGREEQAPQSAVHRLQTGVIAMGCSIAISVHAMNWPGLAGCAYSVPVASSTSASLLTSALNPAPSFIMNKAAFDGDCF